MIYIFFGILQTNACDMIWKLCLQDGHFHSVILAKNGLPLILTAMKVAAADPPPAAFRLPPPTL